MSLFFRLGRLFRTAGRDILVLWYACRNPSTPVLLKLAAVLVALYLFSPIDIIPDWLAILGWMDDVTLLALGIPAVLRFVPDEALRDARSAADGLLARMRFGAKRS
ncbi:MAG TPA: DUF1232 domain-containing protein [Noviherbaspirillum sp.]